MTLLRADLSAKQKTKREMASEMKELNNDIAMYDSRISDMENDILKTERKRSKLLDMLNSNQCRFERLLKDTKKCSREVKKILKENKKIVSEGKVNRKYVQKQKEEIEGLKASVADQIDSVLNNIDSLNKSRSEWEEKCAQILQKCEKTKEDALRNFYKWVNFSVPLQVWLSSELSSTKTMAAIADLHGLVGEWSSLRAVASEILVMTDGNNQVNTKCKSSYSPGIIHLLKEKSEMKSRILIEENDSLRVDITALEKERRNLHSLLLDLVYFLEEDSKHASSQVNAAVSEMMKSPYPDNYEVSSSLKIPPKSALKKPSEDMEKHDKKTVSYVDNEDTKPSVSFDPSSIASSCDNTTPDVHSASFGRLTDEWVENLKICSKPSIINGLTEELYRNRNSLSDAASLSAVKSKTFADSTIESVRHAILAMETKIMWRYLQGMANDMSARCCRKSMEEWPSIGTPGKSIPDQVPETPHYGKVNFDDNDTVNSTLSAKADESRDNYSEYAKNNLNNLDDGVEFYESWLAYRQLALQTGLSTESIVPSSPSYLLNRSMTIVKKPKTRKHKSLLQSEENGFADMLKERVEHIKSEKLLAQRRKEEFAAQNRAIHEHLTDTDRKIRKSARTTRIQMLQKKLVAKRITRAPSFVQMTEEVSRRLKMNSIPPPVETTEKVLKPSDMTIKEESDDNHSEDSVSDEEMLDDNSFNDGSSVSQSIESRNMLLSEIAEKGISLSENSNHTIPLVGEHSFVENGFAVGFEPKGTSAQTEKMYNELLKKVDKELSDQIVTQLTLKMGPESVSVVVYWQPVEDRLKIKVFCFHRNEEYTCYIDHFILKDLFYKTNLHTDASKIQSLYVIHNLIERMTIESIPRSKALDLSMQLKTSYPNTALPESEEEQEDSGKRQREKKKDRESRMSALLKLNFNESAFVAKTLNTEEEDCIHVLTVRSVIANEVLVCSIAKVKTSSWEDMLNAMPLAHKGKSETNKKEMRVNITNEKNFRNRSTRYVN